MRRSLKTSKKAFETHGAIMPNLVVNVDRLQAALEGPL